MIDVNVCPYRTWKYDSPHDYGYFCAHPNRLISKLPCDPGTSPYPTGCPEIVVTTSDCTTTVNENDGEARLLIAKITKCGSCPFCVPPMRCQLEGGREIDNDGTPIPDWCPLVEGADLDGYTMLSELRDKVLDDVAFDFLVY